MLFEVHFKCRSNAFEFIISLRRSLCRCNVISKINYIKTIVKPTYKHKLGFCTSAFVRNSNGDSFEIRLVGHGEHGNVMRRLKRLIFENETFFSLLLLAHCCLYISTLLRFGRVRPIRLFSGQNDRWSRVKSWTYRYARTRRLRRFDRET